MSGATAFPFVRQNRRKVVTLSTHLRNGGASVLVNGAVFKTVSEIARAGSGRFDSYTPPPTTATRQEQEAGTDVLEMACRRLVTQDLSKNESKKSSKGIPHMIRDWVELNMTPGIGPRAAAKLLERFGSAEAV